MNHPTEDTQAVARLRAVAENISSSVDRLHKHPDVVATLALLEHLQRAVEDERMTASQHVTEIIQVLIQDIRQLPVSRTKLGTGLSAMLVKTKNKRLSMVNKANAQKVRIKSGYAEATALCEDWFKHPHKYQNRSEAQNAILALGGCKDVKTARSWLDKIILAKKPSGTWLTKFEKLVPASKNNQ